MPFIYNNRKTDEIKLISVYFSFTDTHTHTHTRSYAIFFMFSSRSMTKRKKIEKFFEIKSTFFFSECWNVSIFCSHFTIHVFTSVVAKFLNWLMMSLSYHNKLRFYRFDEFYFLNSNLNDFLMVLNFGDKINDIQKNSK